MARATTVTVPRPAQGPEPLPAADQMPLAGPMPAPAGALSTHCAHSTLTRRRASLPAHHDQRPPSGPRAACKAQLRARVGGCAGAKCQVDLWTASDLRPPAGGHLRAEGGKFDYIRPIVAVRERRQLVNGRR